MVAAFATTRRFLCEWQSFLCRYVPVGVMETLPQRINDRPPIFRGRDDLETLMASDCVGDWIKISEMLAHLNGAVYIERVAVNSPGNIVSFRIHKEAGLVHDSAEHVEPEGKRLFRVAGEYNHILLVEPEL